MDILSMFEHAFMIRALIIGIPVSLCASLLGVSLVLKRYSMIGDGLSHVGFGALAIASAFNLTPLPVAIPVVVISAFMLLRISGSSKIKGDSAIALISSSALAIGVTVATLRNGMNTDISNYLFGSIVATSDFDAVLSVGLSVAVMVLFLLFYHKIFAVTFDENFSRATGIKVNFYNVVIAVLTALTVVLGMRIMGTLLISSLIIFPALTSMQICKTFRSVIITSGILSTVCFFAGISVSFFCGTPVGASIVIANLIAFVIFQIAGNLVRQS